MRGYFIRSRSSRSSSCSWTAKATGEGCHGDKNPLRVYFPPTFSPQVCILSTCCMFFFFHSCSLSLHLSAFVFPSLLFLCLSHSALCLFLCLHVSLRRFPLSLNVFFCSHLSFLFLFLPLLSSVPVVLTSCPAVEGGRSRGGKGMLILSPQRWSAVGETERGRERKCHSSEEMRWPLPCVCVCVSACVSIARIRVTV